MRQHTSSPGLPRAALSLAALAAVMSLAACHTAPQRNAQLDEARRVYADASANPEVTQSAQPELDRARKALYTAETAWKDKKDEADINHLSYLATQQSKVAINVAMQHAADKMVTAAGPERERALADARTQEAQAARAQAAVATDRAKALEKELQTLQGKQTKRGTVVVLQQGVLFDVGKSDLKPGAKNRLDKLAEVAKNHPDRKLVIEGYTDSTGSDELNQTLSEQRAEAVKGALTDMGVPADRIEAKGHGEADPVASNDSAAGRQQNRRVEVLFSDPQQGTATPAQ